MHIKNSPVKGYKTDFSGFELDASAIELHSADKHNIRLPYFGKLPDALQDNDGAYIAVNITVHLTVGICLVAKIGNKERHYPIEATTKEKNDLLFSFLFVDKGNNAYHVRWDTGLTRYWMGNYQSSYTTWSRFIHEGQGICDVIDQLSPDALNRVVRHIEHKKTA